MGILDQVTDLKNQGVPENDIINTLKEQGVSPKMIDDALNQAKIKSAVSSESVGEGMQPSIMRPERAEALPTEGRGPSEEDLTPPPVPLRIPAAAQKSFAPMTQEMSEEEYVPSPQGEETYESAYPQPQHPSQEYYPQENYEYSPAGSGADDTDTMIEISEQVFAEKIKTMQKQLEDLIEFKTLSQTKIDNISDRLKRIETTIDRLQTAILEKVGSYGRGLESVKKEMAMMQSSFGKIVNRVADKTEKQHHIIHRSRKTTTVVHRSGKRKKRSKKK